LTTLNVTAHRLENLVHDRRAILAARSTNKPLPIDRVIPSE
jgi:hypothetical protein